MHLQIHWNRWNLVCLFLCSRKMAITFGHDCVLLEEKHERGSATLSDSALCLKTAESVLYVLCMVNVGEVWPYDKVATSRIPASFTYWFFFFFCLFFFFFFWGGGKHGYVNVSPIIPQHWKDTSNWNSSLWNANIYLTHSQYRDCWWTDDAMSHP